MRETIPSIAQEFSPVTELDLHAIAKTTKKTLERLTFFAHMRSSSGPNPLLNNIAGKIGVFIKLIDSSMCAAHLGVQLASAAMILCDSAGANREGAITLADLRSISSKGYDISTSVMEGFSNIKYDICSAFTKGSSFKVFLLVYPMHAQTRYFLLNDVGDDLLNNLDLFSEFSRLVTSIAEWWRWIKEDLHSEAPTSLPSSPLPPLRAKAKGDGYNALQKYARWRELQMGLLKYHITLASTHTRFSDLLPRSYEAWKSLHPASNPEAAAAEQNPRSDDTHKAPGVPHISSRPKGITGDPVGSPLWRAFLRTFWKLSLSPPSRPSLRREISLKNERRRMRSK